MANQLRLFLAILLCIVLLTFTFEYYKFDFEEEVNINDIVTQVVTKRIYNNCSQELNDRHIEVKDWHPNIVAPGDHFYLLESSNASFGFYLNPRQACAIESTARANQNSQVYFFITSRTYPDDVMLNIVSGYDNVHLVRINIDSFLRDTPLHELLASGKIVGSKYRKFHLSDVLRYATLYRYPGTYLDLDFVVMTSLEKEKNYAGAEDNKNVAAGIINLSSDIIGREIATQCAEQLAKTFSLTEWRNNGPGIIESISRTRCKINRTSLMSRKRCNGYRVLTSKYFYPISFIKWERYFEEKTVEPAMRLLKKSWAVHVWNKLSSEQSLIKSVDVPYTRLAKKFCPLVFENTPDFF